MMLQMTMEEQHPVELSTLPPEILHNILKSLPLSPLLIFARTSKYNYQAAISTLTRLQLAILPRHVHGVLAFLNSDFSNPEYLYPGDDGQQDEHHRVIVPSHPLAKTTSTPTHRSRRRDCTLKSAGEHREIQVACQNILTTSILSTQSLSNLQSLTIHMYDLTSSALSHTLATQFPHLRHLHLNFFHPYVHDACLPAFHWRSTPSGTPAWNALAGIGDENSRNLRLHTLESLSIERASLTPVQLSKWIAANPNLKDLSLRNISGVDTEFLDLLTKIYSGESSHSPLHSLKLELCQNLSLKSDHDLASLDRLLCSSPPISAISHLSFRGSLNVDTKLIRGRCLANQDNSQFPNWRIERLTLPRSQQHDAISPFSSLMTNGDSEEIVFSSSKDSSLEVKTQVVQERSKDIAPTENDVLEVDPACM